MDNLLQGSANTLNSHGAVVDSDSDGANEMDMDDSLPKSSKGIFEFQTCLTILLKIRESNLMVIQNNVSLKFKPEAFLMKCTWQ